LFERDALVAAQGGITEQDRADLCAGFQVAVADVLTQKTARAIELYLQDNPPKSVIAVAGGVAANSAIRTGLETLSAAQNVKFVAPPLALCTDNAAMIAWAGIELAHVGHKGLDPLIARPRWPLDDQQPALIGSGKKGAKA